MLIHNTAVISCKSKRNTIELTLLEQTRDLENTSSVSGSSGIQEEEPPAGTKFTRIEVSYSHILVHCWQKFKEYIIVKTALFILEFTDVSNSLSGLA